MTINIFSREGNDATIQSVNVKQARGGASLFNFELLIDGLTQAVTATAYINPRLNTKMVALAKVYGNFKAGDRVHANLYKSGQYIDVYRLQALDIKPKKRKKRHQRVFAAQQTVDDDQPMVYQRSSAPLQDFSFDD